MNEQPVENHCFFNMAMASISGRILYNDLKMVVAMTYCEGGGIERVSRMEFPTIKKENGIMLTPNSERKRKKNVILWRALFLRFKSSPSQLGTIIDFCNNRTQVVQSFP